MSRVTMGTPLSVGVTVGVSWGDVFLNNIVFIEYFLKIQVPASHQNKVRRDSNKYANPLPSKESGFFVVR